MMERVFGPDDPETLSDRANMARFTGEAGDAASARDQFTALLPVSARLLGPDHPNTLLARVRLARFTGEGGMRPGPATKAPRCCPSSSGSWAPSTRTP